MGLWNKIFYSKHYNEFYPIEEKTYMIDLINNGIWKTSSDVASESVQDFVKVLRSEIASVELDIDANGRATEKCLKNKKIVTKHRDKKNKKTTTEEEHIKVTKVGFDKLKAQYEDEYTTLGEYRDSVELLLNKVENGKVDSADYELINYILIKNRHSVSLWLGIFAAFAVLIYFLIALSISNGLITL